MEPSFKRQRILATREQERQSPGYDGHRRSYDPATLRQPLNSISGAVYNSNNGPTKFYKAVNAREGSVNFEDNEFDDDEESGEEFYEEEAPEADLQATRQKLDNRLKSTFEAIFEKYGKDFSGVGDEIDLRTGEIVVDNGHVAEMHAETDAGEERSRGMVRAFTEEPEQARLPQRVVEDSDDTEDADDTDEAHENMDMDYHVRGRQMLRAFTQEPDIGRDAGTEEDENENDYDGDTSKLNMIDEDESDDDDILYQSSGVILAKSMAPPPRPTLHKPFQHNPQSRLHALKSVPSKRPSSSSAAYPSEPDILAQFGQELGPRIDEYVSRQKSVDEGSIDPKWRTPALPAATAGKRPILKSIILQPDTERSPSPNGNSLWAPEKQSRRRRRRANKKDKGPSGESETTVRDRTVIERERVMRLGVSAQADHQPESAQVYAPQNPPQQDLMSESTGQNSDHDPFRDNEPGNSSIVEESVAGTSHSSELTRRVNRRPGKSDMCAPRAKYTDAEDKQILEWAEWVYNETEYGFWSKPHWELLSKKNPRHSGTSFRQRYRKFYDINRGRHPFLGSETADQDAPRDLSVKPDLPTDSGATVGMSGSDQATGGPPISQNTTSKTIMAAEDESKTLEAQPIPPANGSSVAGTPKQKQASVRWLSHAQKRFEPFKKIIHELYMVKKYSVGELMSTMELKYAFIEHDNQYRRQFKIWGFERERVESETSLALDQTDEGESKDTEKGPEYTAATRRDAQNKRRREKRREQREQTIHLREVAKKGVPLPTPDPDEIERIEARNEEQRVNRMKLLETMGQLPNLDHDEIEQRKEDAEENTSTRNEAGEDHGSDDQEYLFEHGGSYDLSKLLQGASDYISPNSAIAMEEDQTVELPDNRSQHNNNPETNYTSRSLRSRVIPNSQSSQDLLSPCTSQAKPDQVTAPMAALHNNDPETNYTSRSLRSRVIPNSQSSQDLLSPSTSQAKPDQGTAPMAALSRDDPDPSYMFFDEENEAAPIVPQTRALNPISSSTTTESPNPQPLGDSASLITPLVQEPDTRLQSTPTKTLPTEQPGAAITPTEIKDEPGTISRGLGDIYALPRSPPRLPTAPKPVASGGTPRVVITQPTSSSPLTSPAARTPTPPATLITSVSKATPKQSPVLESTPRRSQASLLKLSSTPTPRRNPMERSTSRPRLTSRMTGSARSRTSMTPISRLAIQSPLRHSTDEEEDEDESGGIAHLLSQRSRAVGGGISTLSSRKGFGASVPVVGTPSRRGRVGSGSSGVSGDGDLMQTPGGAWRRCGESGYKCGRGFCFRCSVGGE